MKTVLALLLVAAVQCHNVYRKGNVSLSAAKQFSSSAVPREVTESCSEDSFQCASGSSILFPDLQGCIPQAWVCDEEYDCDQGEDEANCDGSTLY